MKILHIEDSPEASAIYSNGLTLENHDFESTIDGKVGLDLVLKNDYDLILLDMCMPNYSGIDFLLDLKSKKSSEIRKVIILSSLKLDDYQTRFLMDLGVCSIQEKPMPVQKLVSQLIPEYIL